MQTNHTNFLQRAVVFVLVALTPFLVWYLFDVIFIAGGAIVLATLLRFGVYLSGGGFGFRGALL